MAIAARCLEVTFSLTGEEEAERIEGVEVFKYLGRLLDRSDENWTEVLSNIRKGTSGVGADQEVATEGGGGAGSLENFLP